MKYLFKKRKEAIEYVYDRSSIIHQYKAQQAADLKTFMAAIVGTLLGLYFISLL